MLQQYESEINLRVFIFIITAEARNLQIDHSILTLIVENYLKQVIPL